jgi:arylsulfatase A-like enzyme
MGAVKTIKRRLSVTQILMMALLLAPLGCSGLSQRDARPLAAPAVSSLPSRLNRPDRPNIVVVLSDDHRWDALGAAGNPAILTPVMDRMVRDGVYFRQATVSVSQCHPIRASLLTGLPAYRHGVYSTKFVAPGAAETLCQGPTVASLLRDAGYHTVVVGKWHVPPPPWKCGFDEVRTWLPEGGSEFRDPELGVIQPLGLLSV